MADGERAGVREVDVEVAVVVQVDEFESSIGLIGHWTGPEGLCPEHSTRVRVQRDRFIAAVANDEIHVAVAIEIGHSSATSGIGGDGKASGRLIGEDSATVVDEHNVLTAVDHDDVEIAVVVDVAGKHGAGLIGSGRQPPRGLVGEHAARRNTHPDRPRLDSR